MCETTKTYAGAELKAWRERLGLSEAWAEKVLNSVALGTIGRSSNGGNVRRLAIECSIGTYSEGSDSQMRTALAAALEAEERSRLVEPVCPEGVRESLGVVADGRARTSIYLSLRDAGPPAACIVVDADGCVRVQGGSGCRGRGAAGLRSGVFDLLGTRLRSQVRADHHRRRSPGGWAVSRDLTVLGVALRFVSEDARFTMYSGSGSLGALALTAFDYGDRWSVLVTSEAPVCIQLTGKGATAEAAMRDLLVAYQGIHAAQLAMGVELAALDAGGVAL